MKNACIQKFGKILSEKDTFLLTSHIDPDGDGIGGILGMYHALKNLGKDVRMVLSGDVGKRYLFLPGAEHITVGIPHNLPKDKNTVLMTVDAPNIPRLGFDEESIESLNPYVVNLDHHTSNENFGDLVLMDEKASASCEMVFYLLEGLNVTWTPDMATACYTGILTDTGRFRFSNTRPETFTAASKLLAQGAAHEQIVRILFEEKSYGRLQLEALVLNTMKKEGPLAWMHCTKSMMEQTNCDDTENLVNRLTEISDVEVAVFLREVSDNLTKVSFRAVNSVDVNEIAGQFGGGGHAKASGAKLPHNLSTSTKKIIEACNTVLS
ncbi:MAG: bifunctional oligoribonuclease/PAP phosphatase NrnA [bacterium]|nr:bifunctional oligoribonuclease/PAP phosphatase NrnA [bacterium]